MITAHRPIFVASVSLCVSAAFAGTPALNWTSASTNGTSVTSTRGFSFNVLASAGIDVTDLCFFDSGADGLADAHDVGIFNSAGTLLVWTTIANGTSSPLDVNNLFRVKAITPFHLAQGNDYAVGAVFISGSTDLQAISFVGLATPPEIAYGQTRFNNNGVASLSFPASTITQTGLPGGSFQFTPVPEPATYAAFGLGALLLMRRRRKQ